LQTSVSAKNTVQPLEQTSPGRKIRRRHFRNLRTANESGAQHAKANAHQVRTKKWSKAIKMKTNVLTDVNRSSVQR